ncbi:hypothetical protein A9Q84_03730 [Halobacteriovorax marinus]|uniref:Transglycosylase SLT domain-containing protein n=1 Tax=Halobacteriovorax marinus TaxID=97084 RepID=A0A1Y5FFV2_9BACT|nr:hypothetical protein A9Q84_03730 [Halobacteriovorax marinus]
MNNTSKFIVFFIFLSLFSCKKPGGLSSGSGGIPSSTNVNKWMQDQTSSKTNCPVIVDGVSKESAFPLIAPVGKKAWSDEWSKEIYDTLDSERIANLTSTKLNRSDLNDLHCPNYNSMNEADKKNFWVILMASMSYAESSFDTSNYYDEKGTNDSYGLLQIDAPNARAYGCKTAKGISPMGSKSGRSGGGDMYKPKVNLRCGLYILNRQIERTGGSIFSSKSYWAVLRKSRKGSAKMTSRFTAQIQQIPTCQKNFQSPIATDKEVGEGSTLSEDERCRTVGDSARRAKEQSESKTSTDTIETSTKQTQK